MHRIKHVLFHEFFDQRDEVQILHDLGVVAAREQAHPQDVAVDDVVDQRLERIVRIDQRQNLDHGFSRDAGHSIVDDGRNVDLCWIAPLERLNRHIITSMPVQQMPTRLKPAGAPAAMASSFMAIA